jgi:6-phosphogluconolactonase/glucosamine-6-phosphate isomerase/deaminase
MPPYVERITLTPPALVNSRDILMIVAGSSKADAVRAALHEPFDVARYPAQLLRAAGDRVEWILDQSAAPR